MKKQVIALLLTLLHLFSIFIANASALSPTKLNVLCQQTSHECLAQIEISLKSTSNNSLRWYEIIIMKMEALYTLEKREELDLLLNKLKKMSNLPVYFNIKIYYYLAKVTSTPSLRDEYLKKATNLLTLANEVYFDPLLLLDIYILKLYEKDNDKLQASFSELKILETKYLKSINPLLNRELYTTLGHYAYVLNSTVKLKSYRQKALYWAKEHGNVQQIGVTHYNLALVYQVFKQWDEALTHFRNAMTKAEEAKDIALFKIAEQKVKDVALLQKKD